MSAAESQDGSVFSQEVLAEVPGGEKPADAGDGEEDLGGEKVELDRADLPLSFEEPEPEPEPEPEVEVDLADEPEDDHFAEEEPPKRKVRKWAFGVVLLAVLLGLGLGLWYGYLKPGDPKGPIKPKPYYFLGPIPDPALTLRVELKPFIVPLLDSPQGRILRVAVSLESQDVEGKRLLGEDKRLLRDVIYRLLRGRPAAEIRTPQGKSLLRAQIKAEVNHAMKRQLVHKVMFTEFVITG